MKQFLILLLVVLPQMASAESAHVKVSPFTQQIDLLRNDVSIQSAKLILTTEFCLLANTCTGGAETSKEEILSINQKAETLTIQLKQEMKLLTVRPLVYKVHYCESLIILQATDSTGQKLIGRLVPGIFGNSPKECSSRERADDSIREYFEKDQSVTWLRQ